MYITPYGFAVINQSKETPYEIIPSCKNEIMHKV